MKSAKLHVHMRIKLYILLNCNSVSNGRADDPMTTLGGFNPDSPMQAIMFLGRTLPPPYLCECNVQVKVKVKLQMLGRANFQTHQT